MHAFTLACSCIPNTGTVVLSLFQKLLPYTGCTQQFSQLCEELLQSVDLTQEVPSDTLHLLSGILQTALVPRDWLEALKSLGNATPPSSTVQLSTAAVTKLVELVTQVRSEQLDSVVCVVVTQLLQGGRICTHMPPSTTTSDCMPVSTVLACFKTQLEGLFTAQMESVTRESQDKSVHRCQGQDTEAAPPSSSKVSPELMKQLGELLPVILSRTSAKGLLDTAVCDRLFSAVLGSPSRSALPDNVPLLQLFNHCLQSPSVARSRMASLLIQHHPPSCEQFSGMIPNVLEAIECEPDEERLHLRLHVVEKYLLVMEQTAEQEKGTQCPVHLCVCVPPSPCAA